MKTVVLAGGSGREAGTLLAQRSLTLTGFLRVRLEGNRKVQGTVRLRFNGLVRLKKLTISRVHGFGYPGSVVQSSMTILSICMYKRWLFKSNSSIIDTIRISV